MSGDKIKEIYEKNIFIPSQNNICGIVTNENKAYKCPPNKFCNFAGQVGICENVDCTPYPFYNKYKEMDFRKFDGSDVSRNIFKNTCEEKISTNEKCGLDNNSTKCPDNKCCSLDGKCGNDKESCLYIDPRYNSLHNDNFYNNILSNVNSNYFSNYNFYYSLYHE